MSNTKNRIIMARIKKKGLDYFPLNTDFIHDRAVRRLMKREGDSALGILVEILSYIYAGEGVLCPCGPFVLRRPLGGSVREEC